MSIVVWRRTNGTAVGIVRDGTAMLGAITEHTSPSLGERYFRAVAWEQLPGGGVELAGTAVSEEDAKTLIDKWHVENSIGKGAKQ